MVRNRVLPHLAALLALTVLAAGTGVVTAAPAAAAPAAVSLTGVDEQMLAAINNERTARGIAPLTAARGLAQVALAWSSALDGGATGYQLQHDPDAWTQVAQQGASNRRAWAENVAWSSVPLNGAQLVNVYMHSPGHRANILNPAYRYIGLGTVSGAHGEWNTTEFTDAVEPGQAVSTALAAVAVRAAPALRDGMFVRDTITRVNYRIVGGAPVVVYDWAAFGGPQPTAPVTSAQLAALPRHPASGTFITDLGTHRVFRIAGGAPLYVTHWSNFGGIRPTIGVDPVSVARAGGPGYWGHLAATPVDDTYVQAGLRTYRILSGVAHYIASWAQVGGAKPVTVIDPLVIAQAGRPGSHLRGVVG